MDEVTSSRSLANQHQKRRRNHPLIIGIRYECGNGNPNAEYMFSAVRVVRKTDVAITSFSHWVGVVVVVVVNKRKIQAVIMVLG